MGEETVNWDAREIFVPYLEKLDNRANIFKTRIEMQEGDIEDIIEFILGYYSSLRTIWRKLSSIAPEKTKEMKKDYLKKFKKEISELRTQKNTIHNFNSFALPRKLIDDLEDFHMALNKLRHKKGLVVPIDKHEELTPGEAALAGLNE